MENSNLNASFNDRYFDAVCIPFAFKDALFLTTYHYEGKLGFRLFILQIWVSFFMKFHFNFRCLRSKLLKSAHEMIIKIQEWFFKKFGSIVPVQLLESKKKNSTTKKYFLACNRSIHKFELQNNESAKNQYTARPGLC